MARRDLSNPLAASTFGEGDPKKLTKRAVKKARNTAPKEMSSKAASQVKNKSLDKTPKKTPFQKWLDEGGKSVRQLFKDYPSSNYPTKKSQDKYISDKRKRHIKGKDCGSSSRWRARNPNKCSATKK